MCNILLSGTRGRVVWCQLCSGLPVKTPYIRWDTPLCWVMEYSRVVMSSLFMSYIGGGVPWIWVGIEKNPPLEHS